MKCPNGVICIDKLNIFFVILLAIVILYGVNKQMYMNVYKKQETMDTNKSDILQELIKSNSSLQEKQIQQDNQYRILEQGYKKDLADLKSKQSQRQQSQQQTPINIPTRGDTPPHKQKGILYKGSINDSSSKPGDNSDSVILPLYGKRCYQRSQNWFYYTMSNNYNSMKIPITINGDDCTDDRGCKELNDGDTVTIPSYNGVFTCKMYKDEKLRYIPYIT